MTIRLHVRYFAAARDQAGTATDDVEVEVAVTLAAVRTALGERHPALVPVLRQSRLALRHRFVDDDTTLSADDDGAELSVIPPVAGG